MNHSLWTYELRNDLLIQSGFQLQVFFSQNQGFHTKNETTPNERELLSNIGSYVQWFPLTVELLRRSFSSQPLVLTSLKSPKVASHFVTMLLGIPVYKLNISECF